MAAVMDALALRGLARTAMLQAGGRGFMRFAPEDGALLVSDALRRCAQESERMHLVQVLEAAGFDAQAPDGLLLLTPRDALLREIPAPESAAIDWDSELLAARTLAARWLAAPTEALTKDGRQLILETLRLTWRPKGEVLLGLAALRARAAVMLRRHDTSGMQEAGRILVNWCDKEEKCNEG